jgi:hypothetical protein
MVVWRVRPDTYRLLLVAAVPFVVRDVSDIAGFLYYLIPAVALVLAVEVTFRARFRWVVGWMVARWALYSVAGRGLDPALCAAALAVFDTATIVVLVRGATHRPADAPS